MSPGEGDAHRNLVDATAYAAVRHAVEVAEALGLEYVLAGGWAVAAYGSRIPSVDADIFLPRRQLGDFRSHFDGRFPEEAQRVDLLDLDARNCILGPDVELGEAEEGYVPSDLFRGRTTRRRLALPGGAVDATVPQPVPLCVTKLKAYHDRALAWRACRDPTVMAGIPPTDRPGVREKAESYWYRKAGKDLYDLAYLASHGTSLEDALGLAGKVGLRERLEAAWQDPPGPLLAFALDLASDDAATTGFLRDLPGPVR